MKKLIHALLLFFISINAFAQDKPPSGAMLVSPNFTWYTKTSPEDTLIYGYSNNKWINFARRTWVKRFVDSLVASRIAVLDSRFGRLSATNFWTGYNNFQDVGIRTGALSPYGGTLIPGDLSAGNLIVSSLNSGPFIGVTTKRNGVPTFRSGEAAGGNSFVIQKYVNGGWQNVFKTDSSIVSASNGLTKQGNSIQLGGDLTQYTVINANTQQFAVQSPNTNFAINPAAKTIQQYTFSDTGDLGFINIANGEVNILYQSPNYVTKGLSFRGGTQGILVDDALDQKGLEGSDYYGANYTDNTYVQKKYVTEALTAAGANYAQINAGNEYHGNQTYHDKVYLSGDAVDALEPITKNQFDNYVTGITWKQEVRAGTTGNITLSGTQTVDGVALAVNDRVLVKTQTSPAANGIYLVKSGTWIRSVDADEPSEIASAAVLVRLGSVNKNTQWTCTNITDPLIGTDAITFGQLSGAGTYTNGTGLTLNANVFDVNYNTLDNRYAQTQAQNTFNASQTINGLLTVNYGGSALLIAGRNLYGYGYSGLTLDSNCTLTARGAINLTTRNGLPGQKTFKFLDDNIYLNNGTDRVVNTIDALTYAKNNTDNTLNGNQKINGGLDVTGGINTFRANAYQQFFINGVRKMLISDGQNADGQLEGPWYVPMTPTSPLGIANKIYVDGAVTTIGDARYGQLYTQNTWTNTNFFNGSTVLSTTSVLGNFEVRKPSDQSLLVGFSGSGILSYIPFKGTTVNITSAPSVPVSGINLGTTGANNNILTWTSSLTRSTMLDSPYPATVRQYKLPYLNTSTTPSVLADSASVMAAITSAAAGYAPASGSTNYEAPLTFNSPLVRSGNAISIQQASASQAGFLSAADFNTFNGKQSPGTTLAQYGITDAYTKTQSEANYVNLTAAQTVGGAKTWNGAQSISRSVADNTTLLTINNQTGTGNLLNMQAAGSTVAYVTTSGTYYGGGFNNFTSSNNAAVSVLNSGTVIQRNIADANTALIVNNANATSTAAIQVWQFNSVNQAVMDKDGSLFLNRLKANGGSANAQIDLSATGTTITHNVADNINALTVNQVNASSTGSIQSWQFAGSEVARLQTNGYLYTKGIIDLGGSSNGFFGVGTSTVGNSITRNIADAAPTLFVNNANASSTGAIFRAQSVGVDRFTIAANGDMYVYNTVGVGGTGVFTPGAKFHIVQTTNGISGGLRIDNIAATGAARIWVDGSDNTRISANSSEANSILLNGGSTGKVGINTTSATHGLTFGSTSTGVAMYATADQTTNYARVRQFFVGNNYYVQSEQGGTGVSPDFTFASNGIGVTYSNSGANGYKILNDVTTTSLAGAGGLMTNRATLASTSALQNFYGWTPTINQVSSTGGYRMLFGSVYEQSVGSGAKLLIDVGTNTAANASGTHDSKYSVDNVGNSIQKGSLKSAGRQAATLATTLTANYSTTVSDEIIPTNSTAGGFNITLLSTAAIGTVYTIDNSAATANAVTVIGTINGATNYTLNPLKTLTIYKTSTGTNTWRIIFSN